MAFQLASIQLENFKSLKKTEQIKFKKLTLLTGANSSGKSSVLQAIVGALQSNAFPMLFSTNGKYFNMGDFVDISHKHDKKGKVSLEFNLKENEKNYEFAIGTKWKLNTLTKLPQLQTLYANSPFLTLSLERVGRNFIANCNYDSDKDPDVNEEQKEFTYSILKMINDRRKLENKAPKIKAENLFSSFSIENAKISINPSGIINPGKHARLAEKIRELIGVFKVIGDQTNLISSFRLHPNRTHLENSQDFYKIKKFGEGYLDQIIRWENGNKKKFKELVGYLKDLSLLYSIQTSRIGGGRYDTLVTTSPNGTKVSLSDVGFGVSQFLPILVADLQMGENSNLIVAQPEIHLHPKSQAQFGSYLVQQIEEKKKNYIIETHSEYLLNRIRLAIVEGKLNEDDLAVYYMENLRGETKIYELKFTTKGEIKNAPKGFFDTYIMDLKDIALKAEL